MVLTTSRTRDDTNLGPEAPIGVVGTGAAEAAADKGAEDSADNGVKPEDNEDDVSKATYTARSYPLSGGSTSESREPVVDSSEDRREPEEQSSTARDTSLAGAGTIVGAGAVGAGALAAHENKNNADDVEQATYTDRSYPVGSASGTQEGAQERELVGTTDRLAPHVPGEFPTETGEDPHVPGQFPADSGPGPGVTSAAGLTFGGAAAGGAGASSYTDDASKATERDLHPGGSSFPHESSQTSDSHAGRDAAIVGGAAAATGVAGGTAYAATQGDDKPAPPSGDVGREEAKNLTTISPGSPEKNPSTVPVAQEPTKDDVAQKGEESNLGRNTAIAGGATAAAGAGAAGLYYAQKDSTDDSSAQNWPESPRDVGGEHAKNLTTVPPGSPEKNPSTVPVAQEPTRDDVAQKKEDDSNFGRNAAIAGGATAAAGAGGAAAYYGTRDDEPQQAQQTEEKKSFFDKLRGKKDEKETKEEEKKKTTTSTATTEKSREKEPQEPAKYEEKDSNLGRDAAIAGGAAAAGGGAAYYATRDDEAEQDEEKKGVLEK